MRNRNEQSGFEQEFEGATQLAPETETVVTEGTEGTEGTEINTDAPAAGEEKTYTLADGKQGSRAAFIREKFLNDNMSRKDIAEKFGFPYRIVYSATVNMNNSAEATSRGRSANNSVVKVTADNKLVEVKQVEGVDVVFVNGEATDLDITTLELTEKSRNAWIQEVVAAGMNRSDVATILDMSYGVIYGLTKEQEGTRAKHEVELEGGVKVSRAEYIRMLAAQGMDRGVIAKQLDVPYSVVWQATKTEKSDQEKYDELVKEIAAYADKVEDAETFNTALEIFKATTLKVSKEDADAAAKAEEAEGTQVTE
jgi:transposase